MSDKSSSGSSGKGDEKWGEFREEKGAGEECSLSNEVTEKKLVGSFGTTMNLLNSLLGTGILAVPNSFSAVGMIPSLFILFFMATLGHIATVMVLKLRELSKVDGYDSLVLYYYKKWGSVVFSVLSVIFLTMGCISYIIVGGDMLVSWFAAAGINISAFGPRSLTILIYSLAVPILFSIPKRLKFLSYISTATIVILIIYIIVVLYKLSQFLIETRAINPSMCLARIDVSVFSAISVYSLAFSLPAVAISIFNDFDEDMSKRKACSAWASYICLFIMIIPSIGAYFIFGNMADGNVLNSFPDNDIAMIIVRIGFFIIVSFSYPIIQVPITGSWSQAIFKENNASDLVGWRRALILLISNIIPLIVGMFLPKVKPAIAIGGAFGGCIVDFAFPGLLWIKATTHSIWKWDNILCIILVVFGIIVAILSTYYSILDAIDAFKNFDI